MKTKSMSSFEAAKANADYWRYVTGGDPNIMFGVLTAGPKTITEDELPR